MPMFEEDLVSPKQTILQELQNFPARIFYFEEIDSTNTFLKKYAQACQHKGEPLESLEGIGAVADLQTAGRGRMQRLWHSPAKEGCYFSLLLTPKIEPTKYSLIPLMAAVATAEAIMASCPVKIDIKWPNDILIGKCKVAGILTESCFEASKLSYIVLGIGVNLSQKDFPPNLNRPATSLFLETGLTVDRDKFLTTLLEKIDNWYSLLKIASDNVVNKWESLSSFGKGKQIKLTLEGKQVSGVSVGLSLSGALQVKLSDERQIELYGNEIMVEGEDLCY